MMRVALVSRDYPPGATEGIARQREALARGLVAAGHEVHVVTLGETTGRECVDGVVVHRYALGGRINSYVDGLSVLDRPLSESQLLCEGVLDVHGRHPLDVVDVPLWLAQPLHLVRRAPCPVVVWLQTTLLQLVELQRRDLRRHERVLGAIDREALVRADGIIADSSSILAEVRRLYAVTPPADRVAVVHPALPDAPPVRSLARAGAAVEALVVGRLEARKATPWLFEQLPRLLAAVPALRVRFVGRDNSASDGFCREHGVNYPEAFRLRHPSVADRVSFDGYVTERELHERYAGAHLLLHPAWYESFGLIFLEAMRAGLPTVAWKTGGAVEVFPDGRADGAVLVEPGDADGFVDVVRELATDSDARSAIGRCARARFETRFPLQRMATETGAFYEGVVATGGARFQTAARRGRVFQVMEALQDRDAVSQIARDSAALLATMGGERPILALFAQDVVKKETGRLTATRLGPNDSAIVHYWGYSRLERFFGEFRGSLAVHYHNITPPRFFPPTSPAYEMTARGYAQLSRIAGRFDLIIGDSTYNLRQFAALLRTPRPTICQYPTVDEDDWLSRPFDGAFGDELRAKVRGGSLWLFVGRLAPNKRQDLVMLAFDEYVRCGGEGRLLLVGDSTQVPAYVERLEGVRRALPSGDLIELAGSLSAPRIAACYRAADLFVCASEHEGFCMPVAEAMVAGVPVIALDAGAVGETLDGSGIVLDDWDAAAVARHAAALVESPETRARIVAAQRRRARAFSRRETAGRLRMAVRFLRDGEADDGLVMSDSLAPTAAPAAWSTERGL
jgi:glycosyltransferase involved in cell wall biosynthesis